MVRKKSGGEMASPTPSIDSLSGTALCNDQVRNRNIDRSRSNPTLQFLFFFQNDHCSVESGLGNGGSTSQSASERASSAGSSGCHSGTSPLGGSLFNSSWIKCTVCSNALTRPKVLNCLHSFCYACLENIQKHPEKISCPTCRTETPIGIGGLDSLLNDLGAASVVESLNGACSIDLQVLCTSCKTGETTAVARCFDCSSTLCPACVLAHRVRFHLHRTSQ